MNCDRLYHRDPAWDWAWGPTKLEKTLAKRQSTSRLYCYGSGYGDEADMTSQFRLPATLTSLKIAAENAKLRQSSLEDLLTLARICRNSSFSAWRSATLARIEVMEEHQASQKMIDVCPKASEWSLLPAEVTPGLIQEMVFLPNIITTLEIVTEGSWCRVSTARTPTPARLACT
ncbi:hypothetical protein BGX30_002040 [Mortierella sp. GBA39]|nr:hypothetical protein BGX30_002040 [Mortierella sp. GBA39]